MVNPLIKSASLSSSTTITDTKSIVTLYTHWVSNLLKSPESQFSTITYLGIVELSQYTVRYGTLNRESLTRQLHKFAQAYSLDVREISSILLNFADTVAKTLASEGTVTLYKIGRLDVSENNTIRFISSTAYNREGTPIRGAVNYYFRQRFNSYLHYRKVA